MNIMSWSDFINLPPEKRKEVLPTVVTMDGEPYGLVAPPDDVVYIGDMHPRVKIQLKAREALARKGMPKNDGHKIFLTKDRKDVLMAPKG